MGAPIDRSVIAQWLHSKLMLWGSENISAEHLLKLLIKDLPHLPGDDDL